VSRQYRVVLTRTFQKDFKKLNPKVQQEVLLALKNLEKDPRDPSFHIRKLSGVKVGMWRMRIGDYRIRYDVRESDIIAHRIRHRKDIYR